MYLVWPSLKITCIGQKVVLYQRFLCWILQWVLIALLEAKWLTLTDQATWGFTPRPSFQPCRSTWCPVIRSWEGHWRTWYCTASNAENFNKLKRNPNGAFTPQDAAPGRVSSHWESRVLQGSIMSAVLGDPSTVRIDPVTLAALQDTGWYTVDLSRVQSLVWGDGKETETWRKCTENCLISYHHNRRLNKSWTSTLSDHTF